MREPVLFWDAMQQLMKDGYDTFVEVSPHPVLLHPIEQGLDAIGRKALLLPSLRREEERAVMLGSLGTLYTRGYQVNWHTLYSSNESYVQLPTYPWQHKHFWIDVAYGQAVVGRRGVRGEWPPFLDSRISWRCSRIARSPTAGHWGPRL